MASVQSSGGRFAGLSRSGNFDLPSIGWRVETWNYRKGMRHGETLRVHEKATRLGNGVSVEIFPANQIRAIEFLGSSTKDFNDLRCL
jgi:hypothetical protein